ncbi:MAG: CBS domain-containing protein [Limisphaerales bacterium]
MSGLGDHFTREYNFDPFELARAREVTDRNVPMVPAAMKLSEISDHIAQGDADLSRRQGTLIVDEQNQLVGIITRGDIVSKCSPAKLSEHEPPPSLHPMRPRWREPPRPRRRERSVSAAHRTDHHDDFRGAP